MSEAETLEQLSAFVRADHERLLRIESMLVFQLERDKLTLTSRPTTDQARKLDAMGLPPWQEIVRATNAYEIWKEGFALKMQQLKGERDGSQA